MNEPIWISGRLAIAIHHRQLAEHGGSEGIPDENLLESALARARQLFAYDGVDVDLPSLAATLAAGIAGNHPFIDGNKRIAAVACELFLELNGFVLLADDADMCPIFLGLAAGTTTEEDLTAWLRDLCRPEQVSEEAPSYYAE